MGITCDQPLPPKNSECKHKWIYLDTNQSYYYNNAACRREYYQIDRFYCENCCEIKEIKN